MEVVQNLRLADTRPGTPTDTPLEVRYPTDAAGAPSAFLNVVAVGSAPGHLTVRSCDESGRPTHSTLNHGADVRANLALAGPAPACVHRRSPAHVVAEVVAWLIDA